MRSIELAVVGAGPAGLAAAALADALGLETMLIDEQAGPGGRIITNSRAAAKKNPVSPDERLGRSLVAELNSSRVDYRPSTTVWHIEPDGTLYLSASGETETVSAHRVVLAPGAIERPVPIPGWTLPGVMAAGAAQILLHKSNLVPEGPTVLAGQGPLLYVVANELACAGAPPVMILDTAPLPNYCEAVSIMRKNRPSRHLLLAGLKSLWALRRAGIRVRRASCGLRAIGRGTLQRVAWGGGETAADHLLLHEGMIPNVQISRAMGLHHNWNDAQRSWRPTLDIWGQTSLPCVAVAGDAGAIIGPDAAALSGKLAALDAANLLGRIGEGERDHRARPIRAALDRQNAGRCFFDYLHRPSDPVLFPADDETIVCRCEDVSVGRVRQAARLGASGPNQLKAFTRCGMGPCQGRICGPIATAVIAETVGKPIAEIDSGRPRAPFKPITLGALAGVQLPNTEHWDRGSETRGTTGSKV
ncbi:MAG: NAD(P)/FAD-dependent oxidoreductase [Stellaceae bacterium]